MYLILIFQDPFDQSLFHKLYKGELLKFGYSP